MAATMDLQGARQNNDGAGAGAGVKVKFIETQFVSSDAASFKSVVQRLTGKSSRMPSPPPSVHRPRPRQCSRAGEQGRPCVSGSEQLTTAAPSKQAAAPFTFEPQRVDELCDFADLFYATAGTRRDGRSITNGFPY